MLFPRNGEEEIEEDDFDLVLEEDEVDGDDDGEEVGEMDEDDELLSDVGGFVLGVVFLRRGGSGVRGGPGVVGNDSEDDDAVGDATDSYEQDEDADIVSPAIAPPPSERTVEDDGATERTVEDDEDTFRIGSTSSACSLIGSASMCSLDSLLTCSSTIPCSLDDSLLLTLFFSSILFELNAPHSFPDSGDVATICGEIHTLSGDVSTMCGYITTIPGVIATIGGDIPTMCCPW